MRNFAPLRRSPRTGGNEDLVHEESILSRQNWNTSKIPSTFIRPLRTKNKKNSKRRHSLFYEPGIRYSGSKMYFMSPLKWEFSFFFLRNICGSGLIYKDPKKYFFVLYGHIQDEIRIFIPSKRRALNQSSWGCATGHWTGGQLRQ